MKRNLTIALSVLLLIAVFIAYAPIVVAEFAQTEVIFTVVSNTAFTVTLPDASSATSNATTPSGPLSVPQTTDIWFNSSSSLANAIQPCVQGGVTCQSGYQPPIFQYDNTGNTNISMWLSFNASLPSGVTVTMNSTCMGSANGKGVCHDTVYDVNNSHPALVVSNLSFGGSAPSGNVTNVSLWGAFNNYGPATQFRLLIHNSTYGNPDG